MLGLKNTYTPAAVQLAALCQLRLGHLVCLPAGIKLFSLQATIYTSIPTTFPEPPSPTPFSSSKGLRLGGSQPTYPIKMRVAFLPTPVAEAVDAPGDVKNGIISCTRTIDQVRITNVVAPAWHRFIPIRIVSMYCSTFTIWPRYHHIMTFDSAILSQWVKWIRLLPNR